MTNKLSRKILVAMVTLAVSGILLTALVTNLSLRWNFNRYLRSVQEEQNRLIVDTLAELYGEATSWMAVRRSTVHLGSTTGTQIRVYDNDGRLIVDSLAGMTQGMHGRRWQREQEVRGETYQYPLHVNEAAVGIVEITHLGRQGLLSAEAIVFHRTVQQSALATGLAAALAAVLAGSMLSRRLTGGLGKLMTASETWGHGKFDARVKVDGDDELALLGHTMNRMASRLDEQSRLRKKLTGDISHELRTPLTTIQSYLEAFLDDVMEPNEQNVQAVLEETHRLAGLVNDLQELANNECRSRDVTLSTIELNTFAAAEAERARALLAQKKITLDVRLAQEPLHVLGDEVLLGRVLGNLLVNAFKYTPEGGNVAVTVFAGEDGAGLAVADTGIGIEREHLPYIFERFYRVDPSRTRATGGSGIGLAIVKELVEAMNGLVEVESEPGKGSVFRVILQKSK